MSRSVFGAGWTRGLLLGLILMTLPGVHAQVLPTARQTLQLSGFAGASGVYTGLAGGKNLSVTAGIDLTIRPYFGLSPTVEVRGTYPVDSGNVDSEENLLAGLLIGKRYRGLHPYVDFLYGRGQITYSPAYPNPSQTVYYLATTSGVLSPGGGVDLDLSRHFGFRADVQYQRYATPVTGSGNLYSTPITLGLIYHLDFNRTRGFPNR